MGQTIQTRTYLPARDYRDISAWQHGHGAEVTASDRLPHLGLIVPGLAALFVHDGGRKVGLIGDLVTNPGAPLRLRSRAIDLLMEDILALAFARGIARIYGHTRTKSVAQMAVRHGFQSERAYVLIYEGAHVE